MSFPHASVNAFSQHLDTSVHSNQSLYSTANSSATSARLAGDNNTTTTSTQSSTDSPPPENESSQETPKPHSDKASLQSKIISRKLKGYLFEDSIREFNPEKLYRTKESRKRESYKVHGVNILNRDDIDSKTAIERLQKRRAQHNRVERRRRDMINAAIEELAEIVPNAQQDRFARSNVLRLAIEYIKDLQTEAHNLRNENEDLRSKRPVAPRLSSAKKPPTIVIDPISSQNPPQLQPDVSPSLSPGWDQEPKSPLSLPFGFTGNSDNQIHMTSPTGYSGASSPHYHDKPRLLSLPNQIPQQHRTMPQGLPSVSVVTHCIDEGRTSHARAPHNLHTRHMSIPNVSTHHSSLAPPLSLHHGYHSAPSSPIDSPQNHRYNFFFQ